MSLPGVGEWSFILKIYMKKDNNLSFFFQLFVKRMVRPARGKQGKFVNRKREVIGLMALMKAG